MCLEIQSQCTAHPEKQFPISLVLFFPVDFYSDIFIWLSLVTPRPVLGRDGMQPLAAEIRGWGDALNFTGTEFYFLSLRIMGNWKDLNSGKLNFGKVKAWLWFLAHASTSRITAAAGSYSWDDTESKVNKFCKECHQDHHRLLVSLPCRCLSAVTLLRSQEPEAQPWQPCREDPHCWCKVLGCCLPSTPPTYFQVMP